MRCQQLVWIAFSVAILALHVRANTYYVNPSASCGFTCNGGPNDPLPTISAALQRIFESGGDVLAGDTIVLSAATYSGNDNVGLTILNWPTKISITSTHGSSSTIITCEGSSRGFVVQSSTLLLSGLTIQDCTHAGTGGAVMAIDSDLALDGVVLQHNSALNGGALYAISTTARASLLSLRSSSISANTARQLGGGLFLSNVNVTVEHSLISCNTDVSSKGDDIYCQSGSKIEADYASTLDDIGTYCSSCTITRQVLSDNVVSLQSLCNVDSRCGSASDDAIDAPDNQALCGDNVCDLASESCLSCPQDCTRCSFTGVKVSFYKCLPSQALNPATSTSCFYKAVSRPLPVVEKIYSASTLPVTGVMRGYFRVPESKRYYFKLDAVNLGAKLVVDGLPVIDSFFVQQNISSTQFVALRSDLVHKIEVQFFHKGEVDGPRRISLQWKHDEDDEKFVDFTDAFYSLHNCGDSILDDGESTVGSPFYCPVDVNNTRLSVGLSTSCGSGFCQQEVPETCFTDCYSRITRVCSETIPPAGHVPAGFAMGDDSLGKLVYNQMLWHLPGIEHMANGFQILTGQESLVPVFYFGYCDSHATRLVQDTYRGNIYTLPAEVLAQPHPMCTYSTKKDTFSNSRHLASSYAKKTGMSLSVNVEGKVRAVSGSGSASYSKEKSVQTAKDMESEMDGMLATTEVDCITSRVQMVKHTFHPVFLKDLSMIKNSTDEVMPLLEKYGTHFYQRASLGGRLRQITVVNKSMLSKKTSSDVSKHTDWSFSASVSAPMFTASGSYSKSKDTSVSKEDQEEFESQSIRSSVITYGGAPGSYGPTTAANAPTDFGSWAETVDLLPIPVDYELAEISTVIPETWTTVTGKSLKQLWTDAAAAYYVQNDIVGTQLKNHRYSLYWRLANPAAVTEAPGNFIVRLKDNTNDFSSMIIDQTGPRGSNFPLQFESPFIKVLSKSYGYGPFIAYHFNGPEMDQNVTFRVFPTNSTNKALNNSDLFLLHDWTNSAQYLVNPSNPNWSSSNVSQLWKANYVHGAYQFHYKIRNLSGPPRGATIDEDWRRLNFTVNFNGRRRTVSKIWFPYTLRNAVWPYYTNEVDELFESVQPVAAQSVGEFQSIELMVTVDNRPCGGCALKLQMYDIWVTQTFCYDRQSTTCTSPDEGYTIVYRTATDGFNFEFNAAGWVPPGVVSYRVPLYPLELFLNDT